MSDYEAVIGLEVHVELSTDHKLFCGCANHFGAQPNTLCCPVCAGQPGALPVLNRQAVLFAAKLGTALGCRVNPVSKMARKHYAYPDLPKGYQITQHEHPLCVGGELGYYFEGERHILQIERIHIEEDAGKLTHDSEGNTLLDLNRSGVSLAEIVTRPQLHSGGQAAAALEALALLIRYLDISDTKMHEGSMRADVNVSVRRCGTEALGVRTELKNINSFGMVRRAVAYEVSRQCGILDRGEAVEQQTLRWDDRVGTAIPMRGKETTDDYRYIEEPDLPPVCISDKIKAEIVMQRPELPLQKTDRFMRDYGLPLYEAELLAARRTRADFYELAVAENITQCKQVANWMLGDVARLLNEMGLEIDKTALEPDSLAQLAGMVSAGDLSQSAGKILLEVMLKQGGTPRQLAEEMQLLQQNDVLAMRKLADTVIKSNPAAVKDYTDGKQNVLGFLVGAGMKLSNGSANPELLRNNIKELLEML